MVAETKDGASAAVDYARDSAFLGLVPPPAAGLPDRLLDTAGRPFGPPLCKLTPWRHHLLLGYASPYVTGGSCTVDQLLQALYICSPGFRVGSKWGFRMYRVRWAWFVVRHMESASLALCHWLDSAFMFMPPMRVSKSDGTGTRPEADAPWLVSLMQLGHSVGFPLMDVIHVPYPILWSNIDAMLAAKDQARPKFNRKQDKARGDYLRRKQAKPNAQ